MIEGLSVDGPPVVRQGVHLKNRLQITRAVRGYITVSKFCFEEHLTPAQKKVFGNIDTRPGFVDGRFPNIPVFWLTRPEDDIVVESGLTAFAEDPSSDNWLTTVADTAIVMDIWTVPAQEAIWHERTDYGKTHWIQMWEKIKNTFPIASFEEEHYIFKEVPGPTPRPWTPTPLNQWGGDRMQVIAPYPLPDWHSS